MIIDTKTIRTIEYYLYNYVAISMDISEQREMVLESSPHPPDGQPKSTRPSNTTMDKAIKLVTIAEKQKWLKVIDAAVRHYNHTGKAHLIQYHYFERRCIYLCFNALHIERATYYLWRKEVLTYILIQAVQNGLIRVGEKNFEKV